MSKCIPALYINFLVYLKLLFSLFRVRFVISRKMTRAALGGLPWI